MIVGDATRLQAVRFEEKVQDQDGRAALVALRNETARRLAEPDLMTSEYARLTGVLLDLMERLEQIDIRARAAARGAATASGAALPPGLPAPSPASTSTDWGPDEVSRRRARRRSAAPEAT